LSNKKNLQDWRPKILRPIEPELSRNFGKRKKTQPFFVPYDKYFIMLDKQIKDKKP